MKTTKIIPLVLLILLSSVSCLDRLRSFGQLAQQHCKDFPIEILWRVATGRLSEAYGEQFFDYDCYIHQFVRVDGLDIPEAEEDSDEDQEPKPPKRTEYVPDKDPLVQKYARGLTCLPEDVDKVEATYAIWRFIRFVVQHDYALEWMRAKIRAGLGYEAERPNTWMDGQNGAERLRLDKLFSNQFYDYVDTLMFKDFLFPIMTFLRRNTVIALSGNLTESGKPLFIQSLETHNYLPEIFKPFVFSIEGSGVPIFAYTIPGIPLLFAGSSEKIAWAFTGVLVDRSNVEQIEVVKNKFYNHETEEWIELDSEEYEIPGTNGKICKFMTSPYGTLYTKNDREGKVQEYISRWHEKEKKVRNVFTDVLDVIRKGGVMLDYATMEFPFNSLLLANETGIFQYICPQLYPSYFLYPDMFSEPEEVPERWISYPNKKYVAVSNTILTTMKQQSYSKGEALSPLEEQIAINIRRLNGKLNQETLLLFLENATSTQPQMKKQKNMMLQIYRKVKFFYLPEDSARKECDQLINLLEKWDEDLRNEKLAPIYILWDYFLREYTFNYISASEYGKAIAKHKVVSDNYWVGQMALWQKGTSYGECDSAQYDLIRAEVNGTGHNSSCYLNVIRAINTTRQILFEKYDGKLDNINLKDFTEKEVLDLSEGVKKGSHLEQAMRVHYSRNVLFSSEIGSHRVIYHRSHKEVREEIDMSQFILDPSVLNDEDL